MSSSKKERNIDSTYRVESSGSLVNESLDAIDLIGLFSARLHPPITDARDQEKENRRIKKEGNEKSKVIHLAIILIMHTMR